MKFKLYSGKMYGAFISTKLESLPSPSGTLHAAHHCIIYIDISVFVKAKKMTTQVLRPLMILS